MYIYCDTEVKSDVKLKMAGAAKYFEDASTRTIIVTYQLDPVIGVEVWDLTLNPEAPPALLEATKNPDNIFWAFNASFDMKAFAKAGIPVPMKQWRCLMVCGLSLGFQGGLDDMLERMGIPHRKEREGKRLIRKFCMPQPANRKVREWDRHNAPTDWALFIKYAKKDTAVLEPLREFVAQFNTAPNWDEWFTDQKINNRGIPIDTTLVDKALVLSEEEKENILKEMRDLSGMENPNSKPQVKVWLRDEQNIHLSNMQKATVALALTNPNLPPLARRILELNQRISMTSTAKWDALDRAVCDDGTIKGAHQYLGAARTGRDAHRLFQPGNLPRGSLKKAHLAADMMLEAPREHIEIVYGNVMSVLSSTLRASITAPDGQLLVVADLSGIEGMVLPWQCDFQEKLDQIESGLDMYKVAYSEAFSVPYDEVNKSERFLGKIMELACGFQGAVGAYTSMAMIYGVKIPDSEASRLVKAWRAKNKPIVRYWYACEKAVETTIKNPGTSIRVFHVVFLVVKDFLFVDLPSGRSLAYYKPEYSSDGFTYMGLNGYTRKWERIDSFGGKIVENLTQAIARDVFFAGLRIYEKSGGKVVLRVHDELVSPVLEEEAKEKLQLLIDCMTSVPRWAKGLPLKAAGFIAKRYRK